MMENRLYWCWLQQALHCGARVDEAIAAFGSPRSVYEASEYERRISGAFTVKQIERLSDTPLHQAQEILRTCDKYAVHTVTPDDPCYPARLRELPDFPCVLYVRGDPGVLGEELSLAVVGTRQATEYAAGAARALAGALARSGMVIVSGGALGIDSAAHRAAIDAGGRTICYMGCGFGVHYLMTNSPLRREISEHGALVSEFPPGTPAGKSTFPIRNRLIAGSSLGTLVIEAGVRSGSLITAKCAREMGRDVFAVPGNILTSTFEGANQLIRDGAKPVFSARDILEEYGARFPGRLDPAAADLPLPPAASPEENPMQQHSRGRKKTALRGDTATQAHEFPDASHGTGTVRPLPADASPEQRLIHEAVLHTPLRADEIAQRTGIPVRDLLRVLTQLEVMGYIVQQQGKRYLAVKE